MLWSSLSQKQTLADSLPGMYPHSFNNVRFLWKKTEFYKGESDRGGSRKESLDGVSGGKTQFFLAF